MYLPCLCLSTSPSGPRPGGAILRKRGVNTVARLARSLETGDFPPPVHLPTSLAMHLGETRPPSVPMSPGKLNTEAEVPAGLHPHPLLESGM